MLESVQNFWRHSISVILQDVNHKKKILFDLKSTNFGSTPKNFADPYFIQGKLSFYISLSSVGREYPSVAPPVQRDCIGAPRSEAHQ